LKVEVEGLKLVSFETFELSNEHLQHQDFIFLALNYILHSKKNRNTPDASHSNENIFKGP